MSFYSRLGRCFYLCYHNVYSVSGVRPSLLPFFFLIILNGCMPDACECGNEPSGSVKCGEFLD